MGKSATAVKGYEPQRLNTFNAKGRVQAKKGHSADLQGTLPSVNGVPQYGKSRNSALATVGRLQGQQGTPTKAHNSGCECSTCKGKKSRLSEKIQKEETQFASEFFQHSTRNKGHLYEVPPSPLPGDELLPPGDCSWAKHELLNGSVQAAKAIVSSVGGACTGDDDCITLAIKIAAVSAEIGARNLLHVTCFRGGNRGHLIQVRDRINMHHRCTRFFASKKCPDQLSDAMEQVKQTLGQVAEVVNDVAVAVAKVMLLIGAIILLAKIIAALAVGTAAAAVAATIISMLIGLRDQLSANMA